MIGSPEGTWKNQMIMEKAGLKPLPCYHFGEDTKWLQRYIDKGYDYIALGGMVGRPRPALLQWLDTIWSDYLTDSKGMPIVKIHGFGMTSLRLMLRYPWYSVDSTSWVQQDIETQVIPGMIKIICRHMRKAMAGFIADMPAEFVNPAARIKFRSIRS